MMSIFDNVVVGLWLNGVKSKVVFIEFVECLFKGVNFWIEVKDWLDRLGVGFFGG